MTDSPIRFVSSGAFGLEPDVLTLSEMRERTKALEAGA